MTLRHRGVRSWSLSRLFASGLIAGLVLLGSAPGATAQSIVVMVNDDPITSYDVAQRQRFLALTSGLGERMRARLKSDKTRQEFQAYAQKHRPQTQEEVKELQKKFVADIQRQVISNASGAMRKEAIDQLIEEKLMVQAAKERKIEIADDEVNQALTRMAQGGGSQKRTLDEFLAGFRAQGVNPSTLKERIRAQLAWRDLIRGLYLPLVRSTQSALPASSSANDSGTTVDVEIVRLSVPKNDQKAVANRLVAADEIRKNFSSCTKLRRQLQGKNDISVQSVKAAGLENFAGDVRAALTKAKAGDMTPPIIKGDAVETLAVCAKNVASDSKSKKKSTAASDERQDQLQLYSQRHLRDLRDRALLKYPKNG